MKSADLLELKDRQRRKQLKLRLRADLEFTPQMYEGRTYYIVKDPVSLQYWRFREQEYFILKLMDGVTTLDDAQKQYESRFQPERVKLEELESFAQQIMTAGLARNDSPQLGNQLLERRGKRRRRELAQKFLNILAIRIPVFDPDRLLTRMIHYCRWIFTATFAFASIVVMLSALLLVLTHFETFRSKLPDYHDFFSPHNLVWMWVTLGLVKVIHEFGHGLSCKAFGGEVHEMGFLFLCFSPCLYCNVSDAWTMPVKWRRILISFAGIYVELMVAAIATFVWWNTTGDNYFIHQLALSLMVICSVSTVIFNGNPLLRYDGYHVLADWLEIPNLSHRSNRFLLQLFQEHCLGIEVPPEQYMETKRKVLFVIYAITSYCYRWIVTFGIIWFFYNFLRPYKLGALCGILAVAALASMLGMPAYQLYESIKKRGRLPDMKGWRIVVTTTVFAVIVIGFFTVPLPVSRVRQSGLVQLSPDAVTKVYVPVPGVGDRIPGILKTLSVEDGQYVTENYELAHFFNLDLETQLTEARAQLAMEDAKLYASRDLMQVLKDEQEKSKYRSETARARGERARLAERVTKLDAMKKALTIRSPAAGVVMSPPRNDEIGRQWDRDRTTPFCSIGEPGKLRVLIPLSPSDYRLLKENFDELGDKLVVELRVRGRGAHIWKGKISQMPESDAKEIPMALTAQAGGPVAAKPAPGSNPQTATTAIPQTQQYLVGVDIIDPDGAICPGTMAQVKVRCKWRPAAWWVWRKLSATFDLGLL
jgi:putative peptide zinc metalloprotease protein